MTKVKERKHYWEITEEYLAKLNDEDLRKVFIRARSFLNKARRSKSNKSDLKDREIDLCYIQKEMQNRKEYRK